jgi:adenylate kinase family enzyme
VTEGVWLVIGVQASGKSTVADLLARQFERSMHIRGGQFYRWAVNGWVHPWNEDSAEARRLLDLRYRLSALVANEYCNAGFTAVVQDNIYGEDVRTWLRQVTVRPRYLVVLRPTVEVVRERDKTRRATAAKVAYRQGEVSIQELDELLEATPKVGIWLDTSAQTPFETMREILERRSEAIVDVV